MVSWIFEDTLIYLWEAHKVISLSRASSFNEHNVNNYFNNLSEVMDRYKFEPKNIWNMNETGVTIVQRPNKIVDPKWIKQMGAVNSAERSRLVTVAAAINTQGHTPAFCVFPLKRCQDHMIREGLIGYAGAGTRNKNFCYFWNTSNNKPSPLWMKTVCRCSTIMYHMSLFKPSITVK